VKTTTVTTADATVKTTTVTTTVANAVAFWRLVKRYIGGGFKGLVGRGLGSRRRAVDTPAALGEFIHTRASHVAQTALYGYMKTRAGTRFPALFEDPAMLASINIAKWHVWAACVSDLAVYSGALLRIHGGASASAARAVIVPLVAQALAAGDGDDVGDGDISRHPRSPLSGGDAGDGDVGDGDISRHPRVPLSGGEAGGDFPASAARVMARVANCDLGAFGDDESAFTESPRALVHWAPIADELKARDSEIVRNSVRFRWHEVRRDLRRRLRAPAILAAAEAAAAAAVEAADAPPPAQNNSPPAHQT